MKELDLEALRKNRLKFVQTALKAIDKKEKFLIPARFLPNIDPGKWPPFTSYYIKVGKVKYEVVVEVSIKDGDFNFDYYLWFDKKICSSVLISRVVHMNLLIGLLKANYKNLSGNKENQQELR